MTFDRLVGNQAALFAGLGIARLREQVPESIGMSTTGLRNWCGSTGLPKPEIKGTGIGLGDEYNHFLWKRVKIAQE
jgi:hypothetical protein